MTTIWLFLSNLTVNTITYNPILSLSLFRLLGYFLEYLNNLHYIYFPLTNNQTFLSGTIILGIIYMFTNPRGGSGGYINVQNRKNSLEDENSNDWVDQIKIDNDKYKSWKGFQDLLYSGDVYIVDPRGKIWRVLGNDHVLAMVTYIHWRSKRDPFFPELAFDEDVRRALWEYIQKVQKSSLSIEELKKLHWPCMVSPKNYYVRQKLVYFNNHWKEMPENYEIYDNKHWGKPIANWELEDQVDIDSKDLYWNAEDCLFAIEVVAGTILLVNLIITCPIISPMAMTYYLSTILGSA